MGITKADLFTDAQNELAGIAKALAHPARIAIIEHLIKANACINNDLVEELGLAQATISQHLRELKEIGIIQGTIDGTRMCYCIEPGKWHIIKSLFNSLFNQIDEQGRPTCC
jgi:predicted transcriptional regulator